MVVPHLLRLVYQDDRENKACSVPFLLIGPNIISLTSFFILVLYWEWTGMFIKFTHWLKFSRVSNLMFYLFVERDSDWWCSPIWCGHQWWEFDDCQKALWNGRTAYAYQSKFYSSPYWNSLKVCSQHLSFNFFLILLFADQSVASAWKRRHSASCEHEIYQGLACFSSW